MDSTKPVLITLTGPTCSGKSFLYSHIRDVAKLPCLISTTTRAQREGEVPGRDYIYISHETSLAMEQQGQFAELAIYNGARYGVTKEEFHNKLQTGMCFLIVEPKGISHYAQPAIDAGARHFKVFVHCDESTRVARFKERFKRDLLAVAGVPGRFDDVFEANLRRYDALPMENGWHHEADWDLELDGTKAPQDNLDLILNVLNQVIPSQIEQRGFLWDYTIGCGFDEGKGSIYD